MGFRDRVDRPRNVPLEMLQEMAGAFTNLRASQLRGGGIWICPVRTQWVTHDLEKNQWELNRNFPLFGGICFSYSEPLKRYEFGDFCLGIFKWWPRKGCCCWIIFFLRKAEIGVSLFVEFTLPPLKTNDYPLIINGWFRWNLLCKMVPFQGTC